MGLVTTLAFKTKVRSPKYKKAGYAIGNVSEKDLSKIIKEFEKIGKLTYEKKRPKNEPTPSYFHLVRQLAKCMMRSDKINRHNHCSYTEMNALSSNVNVTDKDESKEIIVHETLSENNSKDVSESERNIVNKTLSQNNYMDVPENTITELKDKEHKEPSVTDKVTGYYNIYECGRNILNQLDVTYQRAFMATPKHKYYNALLDTLVKDNNLRGEPLYNQNIQDAVSDVIEETEA